MMSQNNTQDASAPRPVEPQVTARTLVRWTGTPSTSEWAEGVTRILRVLSGNGDEAISVQIVNHWAPADDSKHSRLPATRDQVWSLALAAAHFHHLHLDRQGSGDPSARAQVVEEVQRWVRSTGYRAIPPHLIDAAMDSSLDQLIRELASGSEFRQSDDSVHSTLQWLLKDWESGETDRHSILCVAALSPPKIDSHPEVKKQLRPFFERGGSYAIFVPYSPPREDVEPTEQPTGSQHLVDHYVQIFEESKLLVCRSLPHLVPKSVNLADQVALLAPADNHDVLWLLRTMPPVAGIEVRPVLCRTVFKSTRTHKDRLACLVTEDHQDRFLRRSTSDQEEGADADTRSRLRLELAAVTEYFGEVLRHWQDNDYSLKGLKDKKSTCWKVIQ